MHDDSVPPLPADTRFAGLRRRGFLAATGAASLGALSLAGCGGSGDGGDPKGGGTPQRGGRLRAAFAGGGGGVALHPHPAN
ncbi:peptide ABC transporter substrate-binding protein, partial [Streptomyces albogriseolus]